MKGIVLATLTACFLLITGKCYSESKTSIVVVKFSQNIWIHWDNATSQIIDDEQFKSVAGQFALNKTHIVSQITNITLTNAMACKTRRLLLGDVAFLLIDKIKSLPFFIITGVQADVFDKGCPYPSAYFTIIGKNRLKIQEKVGVFLRTQSPDGKAH